jgi:hypothetical protein
VDADDIAAQAAGNSAALPAAALPAAALAAHEYVPSAVDRTTPRGAGGRTPRGSVAPSGAAAIGGAGGASSSASSVGGVTTLLDELAALRAQHARRDGQTQHISEGACLAGPCRKEKHSHSLPNKEQSCGMCRLSAAARASLSALE